MRRVPELDGLRGLAILAVLFFHLDHDRLGWGWAGVDLFLVLSGYLITDIILRERDQPRFLLTFFIRRGLRIWPIYYLTLLVVAMMPTWDAPGLWYYLTYTQNVPLYLDPASGTQQYRYGFPQWQPFVHSWSLAAEEQFYLVWPIAICLLGRRGVIPLAALGLLGSFLLRQVGFSVLLLGTRWDGLALGATLAALMADRNSRTRWLVPSIALAAALISASILVTLAVRYPDEMLLSDSFRHAGVEIAAVAFASFAIVAIAVCFTGSRWLEPLRGRPLTFLGVISYGLYIYHYPIFCWFWSLSTRVPGMRNGPLLLTTFAVAVASWYLIERPILRLKDRFGYSRTHAEDRP
jgi:peptidoglycan/LPS O-acetylase OafA/YrhL